MKKKIIALVLGALVLLGVSGCASVGTKTITCESEKVGKSPEIIYYEIYKVKDNEVTSFEKYSVRTYDEEYLKLVSLEETIEVYERDKDIKAEKISDNQLKVVDTNPVNVFKDMKSDDLTTLIVNTMEKNDFALYTYTCEVK